jgi:epoxyqueuosine reductase QueG
VVTSVALEIDHPIDAGIAQFCDNCRACRKFCPPQAIPDHRSPEAGKDHLGYDRYVVDTGRCFPYFAKHSYCSICLPVCAYNHKEWAKDFEGSATKIFPKVIMLEPPPPVDLPDRGRCHTYPRLQRD